MKVTVAIDVEGECWNIYIIFCKRKRHSVDGDFLGVDAGLVAKSWAILERYKTKSDLAKAPQQPLLRQNHMQHLPPDRSRSRAQQRKCTIQFR